MDKDNAQLEHIEGLDDPKRAGGAEDYVPDTEEERKLVQKIDLFLLPTIWIMYLLSYMDRTKYARWQPER